ncbi:MAG: RNA recognition motif domain-containing protein [Betaproteobacteria bacterium]
MRLDDSNASRKVGLALQKLRGHACTTKMIPHLRDLFSAFGGVRGISKLASGELDRVFLIDFEREVHAMRAAQATGFKLFGFATLIVNLAKVHPA